MQKPVVHETTLTRGLGTSVPAEVRKRLNAEPGDTLVWEDDGTRVVVTAKRRRKSFTEFVPFDFPGQADAKEHDEVN